MSSAAVARSSRRNPAAATATATATAATAATTLVTATRQHSSSGLAPSVTHATLRTFLDDCLRVDVGAHRALERLGTEEEDATVVLEELAQYSMEYEERAQTGCLMVQALTLVRCWTLRCGQALTPRNEKAATEWCA